jgi:uncharacterized membrane protein YgcG
MKKFIKSCLNGLALSAKSWLFFGLLLPILFFIVHPFDPMLVLGVSVIGVLLYFSAKWKKEAPAAQQATEEAIRAGVKFEDPHPTDETKESPLKRYKNKYYTALWTSILSACMMSCSYQMIYNNTSKRTSAVASVPASPATDAAKTGRTVAAADSDSVTIWNASNIKMVHLADASQYVTNSDSILSDSTVAAMNTQLKELDSIVGVKPAVVVCRRVDEGGTYRTAVDLINKYKIGNKETGRGICVVVAYDQRQYTIAPSRDLEGDLTDVECSRLGRNCLKPYLKSELPDSALLCLTQALYDTLKDEEADEGINISSLKSGGLFSGENGTMMLTILVLCMIFGIYDDKNKWNKPAQHLAKVIDQPEEPKDDEPEEEVKKESPRPEEPQKPKGGHYGGGSSGGGGATGDW